MDDKSAGLGSIYRWHIWCFKVFLGHYSSVFPCGQSADGAREVSSEWKDTQLNQRIKILLFFLWGLIILSAVYLFLSREVSLQILIEKFRERIMQLGSWGPLLFVAIYSFRSLVFFPASLLTITAAMVFGPLWGFFYTIVGENISANISFVVGRYFGAAVLNRIAARGKLVPLIKCKLHRNGLMAVLTMRLMFLPFDLVGYSSGVCNIRQRDFALGTFIGTLPGLAAFILLGSAIYQIDYLFGSLAIALAMLGLARFLQRREALKHPVAG